MDRSHDLTWVEKGVRKGKYTVSMRGKLIEKHDKVRK
jgi:hypothetical protein